MSPDPKFGYHWIWMIPMYYLYELYDAIINTVRQVNFIVRKMFWHKETKEFSKLAGIKDVRHK